MKHVLLICLLALLCGCSSDRVPDSGESDRVSLSLRIVTGVARTVITPEEELNSIRLLVYDNQSRLEANQLLTFNESESEPGIYQADCELKMAAGKKTFCLVANEEATLPANVLDNDKVGTLAELDDVLLTTIPETGNVLPFSCREVYNIVVGNNSIDLPLRRAVARVDLRLWKADDIEADVVLKKIEITNGATKSRLFAGNPLSTVKAELASNRSWDKDYAFTKAAPEDPLHSCYLFEYIPDDVIGNIPDDVESMPEYEGKVDPTSLKLTFTVNNIEKPAVTIPLAGAKDDAGKYIYCIKRNTLTDLRLTYENGGLKLNYTVTDWDDSEGEYDRELGGSNDSDSNWWYADWIDLDYGEQELEGL